MRARRGAQRHNTRSARRKPPFLLLIDSDGPTPSFLHLESAYINNNTSERVQYVAHGICKIDSKPGEVPLMPDTSESGKPRAYRSEIASGLCTRTRMYLRSL